MTSVTFVPITEEMVTPPEPLPELVIVPEWFADAVEIVIPLAVELLLLKIRFPEPVMLPLTVRMPVPLLLSAKFPFSVVAPAMAVFDPTVVNEVSAVADRLPNVKSTLERSSVALPLIDVEPKIKVGAAVKLAVVGARVALPILRESIV